MNTRILMTISALIMGLGGIVCSFAPEELPGLLHLTPDSAKLQVLTIQILGAVYLGFAFLNWMAKGNLIGGIYSKPVAVGNFTHFMIAGLALIKYLMGHAWQPLVMALAATYAILAICFGLVVFGSPKFESSVKSKA